MISLDEQRKEARRELALRKRCSPGWITRGTLTEGQATYSLEVMAANVPTLARLDAEHRQLPLFGTPRPP